MKHHYVFPVGRLGQHQVKAYKKKNKDAGPRRIVRLDLTTGKTTVIWENEAWKILSSNS